MSGPVYNANRTECSPILSVIIRVITLQGLLVRSSISLIPVYDNFRGLLSRMWFGDLSSAQIFDWLSQLSDYKCPITCKCPIHYLIGGYRPIRFEEIVILLILM